MRMGKRDEDIKSNFRLAEDAMEIDKGKKEEAFLDFRRAIDKKNISFLYSKKQVFINQLCYMDKSVWRMQGILYAVVILLAARLYVLGIEKEEMIVAAMFFAGVMGVFSILGICRAFYSELAELSGSCYFNVGQMMLFQMV